MQLYRLKAFNTATQSENKMHDDDVAASFGFKGGLVPGVDVYAYLCHLPAERWGRDWLERGTMSARFNSPVYDGDEVVIEAEDEAEDDDDGTEVALTLTARGEVCATARATLPDKPPTPTPNPTPDPTPQALIPFKDLPAPQDRPPATPEVVSKLDVLGSTDVGFSAARADEYLDDIREQAAVFRQEKLAHPGWLLRQANFVLSQTVRLGPWIHVSSVCRHFGVVTDQERITTRARVREVYERKGHHFVDLDVQWVAGADRVVMQGQHLAIYQPRRSS